MEELNIEVFKEKMWIINPEMCDVFSYEKGKAIDSWIEGIYKSLPKDKK